MTIMRFRCLRLALLAGAFGLALVPHAHAAVQPNQFNNTVSDALACNGHPYIDVKCYGALGDDSHDDTSAINSAKTDAIANNVPLHFSAGKYKVTSAITIDYAGVADGFRIVSEGATLDGVSIGSGPVLQVSCSGGTTGSPVTCLYFNIRGRLTVLANTPAYAVVLGNNDFSDLHQGMKIEQIVAINSSANAAAGGILVNYLVNGDLWLDGSTSGGNASHAGVEIAQLQKSRLSGRGYAAGASAPALLVDNGIISGNVISAFSYAGSATCIRIASSASIQANFVIAPYYDCTLALDASQGAGSAFVQVAPTYAGVTQGPNSGAMATLGRGSVTRYAAPVASSYTAAGVDDGLLLSSANATGSAAGWAAASLPVTLPDPALVGAGWTMGFVTDANKAVVLSPAAGSLLSGGVSLATMTLGPGNYQTAVVQSDGTNYRVLWASQETLAINGAGNRFPSRPVYPGGPGYSATQGDNGNVISSALASGTLTVTLPGSIASGWTTRLSAVTNALTVNPGGATLVLPGGIGTSAAYSIPAGQNMTVQWDGAVFRVLDLGLFTFNDPVGPDTGNGVSWITTQNLSALSGNERHFVLNTSLSAGSPTSNIWQNFFSIVHLTSGTFNGEISTLHGQIQVDSGVTWGGAESLEARLDNAGTLTGEWAAVLAQPHVTGTGTAGSIFGLKCDPYLNNPTAGTVGVYACVDNVENNLGGGAPTFNLFLRNADATAAITTRGGMVIGSLTPPAPGQFYLQGADTSGGTFPLIYRDSGGSNILIGNNGGQITIRQSAVLTNETIGTSVANQLFLAGNATGQAPVVRAVGSDTNVALNLQAKGTGGVIAGNDDGNILNMGTQSGVTSMQQTLLLGGDATHATEFWAQSDAGLVIQAGSAGAAVKIAHPYVTSVTTTPGSKAFLCGDTGTGQVFFSSGGSC